MLRWMLGANQRSLNLFNEDMEWRGRVDHLVDNDGNFMDIFEVTVPWYDAVAGYTVSFVKDFRELQSAVDYIIKNNKTNINKESPVIMEFMANVGR